MNPEHQPSAKKRNQTFLASSCARSFLILCSSARSSAVSSSSSLKHNTHVTYYQQINKFLLVLPFNKDERPTYSTTKYPSLKWTRNYHVILVLKYTCVYMYMHKQDAICSKILHVHPTKVKKNYTIKLLFSSQLISYHPYL